jgi:hypothetical protein
VSRGAGAGGTGRSLGRLWVVALMMVLFSFQASAQASTPSAPADTAVKVFLMTFGPGRQVWERFGHNAIWVHDPAHGSDEAYNYGLFDFHQQNFVLRFIRGQMWYWMAGFPAAQYVAQYERDNRSVWIQELNLTPAAASELQRFLEWNATPEHRFYHYDYYRDNCSTRVRDAIDRAVGGALRRQTEALPAGSTYRFHTQRLTANDPLIFTGLLTALGQGVDRPITAWEEMFLPLKLREWVRGVTVPGPDGRPVPLVRQERTIFESSAPAPPDAPPNWLGWYLALGLAIGGAAWLLAGQARTRAADRFAFLLVTGSWGAIAGLAGLVLAGLWGLTDHVMAYRNENLLQLEPLALALVPAAFASVRGRTGGRPWVWLAVVVAGLSLLGLLLKALPGLDQVNGPVIALALPAQAGIAAALWRLSQPGTSSRTTPV